MNDAIKLTIIATSVIGAMVVIWSGVIIPEFEKLPNNYSFYMEYDGEDKIIETVDGELSDVFKLRESISLKATSNQGNTLEILSEIKGVRLDTDEIVFDATNNYKVDKITRNAY